MEERRVAIRNRGVRIAGLSAILVLLGTFAPAPPDRPLETAPESAELYAQPLPRAARSASEGALVFLAGWDLSSRAVRFGGVSAMHVQDGQVLALSDSGSIFHFPLPPEAGGRLPLSISRLPSGPGSGRLKSERDSEAVVVHDGRIWISFEGRNQIWRYRREDWAVEASNRPRAMARIPSARGVEAMARLPDGRSLLFAEGPLRDDGTTPLFLFEGDPAEEGTPVETMRYRPPEGYRATDAALLPNGRLLLLNRDFSLTGWWRAKLTIVDARSAEEGAVLPGREIGGFEGLPVDNMEALSVTREGDRTIVWIASDDNFNPLLQRTLLMKFALAE